MEKESCDSSGKKQRQSRENDKKWQKQKKNVKLANHHSKTSCIKHLSRNHPIWHTWHKVNVPLIRLYWFVIYLFLFNRVTMFVEVWYETRCSYVLYNFRWKTAIRIIHSPSHLYFSLLSVGFFLLPHFFICLLISSVLPSFLPSFNILWSGSTIAKSFSPPPNASITLYNPAAWLSESRKSSMCLTWAHRLYPSPKLAQTEVFITEHEWAQKREKEWMERQRRQFIDLSCFF